MPKLRIVNGGALREIELVRGISRIGRTPVNDIQLDHPSVSSVHGEFVIDDRSAVLRDLGSTNGTFVDEQRIEETELRSGQSIRFGSLEMVFEDMRPVVPTAVVSASCCPFHSTVFGSLVCKGCEKWFCAACVNLRRVGGKDLVFCRVCGEECVPVDDCFAIPAEPPSFYREVPRAFAYPFHGEGAFILFSGGLLYLLLHLLGLIGAPIGLLFGIFILIARFILFGYIVASMQKLIEFTAQGDGRPF